MASKKQTITIFFKPCSKEKPSSETSKSRDLSLMDQANLQPNVVCNSSDKPFHPPKNFKFPEKRFGKEDSINHANRNGLKIISGFATM